MPVSVDGLKAGSDMKLHEIDRKEIFSRMVRMQDDGISLEKCRSLIAVEAIREIESEGLTKQWPPL